MSEGRLCPLCGIGKFEYDNSDINDSFAEWYQCNNCGSITSEKYINSRPIEDKMKSLLERLAPEDGVNIVDDDDTYCAFCWLEKYQKKIKEEHAPGCPWVEARKLLEELK